MDKKSKCQVDINGRLKPVSEYSNDTTGRMTHRMDLLLELVYALTQTLIKLSKDTPYDEVTDIINEGLAKAKVISDKLKSSPKL